MQTMVSLLYTRCRHISTKMKEIVAEPFPDKASEKLYLCNRQGLTRLLQSYDLQVPGRVVRLPSLYNQIDRAKSIAHAIT